MRRPAEGPSSICVIVALALSSCARNPPVSPPISQDADWLDGTATLTPARLARVFETGSRDPEIKSLLEAAVARIGQGSQEALFRRFSVCQPNDAPGLAGKTLLRHQMVVVGRGEGYEAQIAIHSRGPDVLDATVREGPDYATIARWLIPAICIQPSLPLAAAYEAVVHELVHALRRSSWIQPFDLAGESSEAAYALAAVQLPGDEVDAYITASRARIRLQGGTRAVLPALARAFDEQGNLLVSREVFGWIVVVPPPQGLDYGRGTLADGLARARAMEISSLQAKHDFLVGYAEIRKQEGAALAKTIEVLTHNLGVREHTIGLARSRGDRGLEDTSRQELANEQRELASARARSAASAESHARVSAEIPVIAARIERLKAR